MIDTVRGWWWALATAPVTTIVIVALVVLAVAIWAGAVIRDQMPDRRFERKVERCIAESESGE